jgi:hypothetical protein
VLPFLYGLYKIVGISLSQTVHLFCVLYVCGVFIASDHHVHLSQANECSISSTAIAPPEIKLNGDEKITIDLGEEYKEPGFIVYDSKKHKYDKEVKIETNLDINTPGEYTITYKLQGKEKKRTIIVLEKVSYKIELESIDNEETIYLRINDEYIEPGYKVIDNNGNDVTASFDVSVTGDVDISNPGTYKIVYEIMHNISYNTFKILYPLQALYHR